MFNYTHWCISPLSNTASIPRSEFAEIALDCGHLPYEEQSQGSKSFSRVFSGSVDAVRGGGSGTLWLPNACTITG